MFDCQLFLGFPLNSELSERLSALPQAVRESFIQKEISSLHLQQIEYEGVLYLGKALGVLFDTEALTAMKEHLLSVIFRLLPEASCNGRSLILLAIPLIASNTPTN